MLSESESDLGVLTMALPGVVIGVIVEVAVGMLRESESDLGVLMILLLGEVIGVIVEVAVGVHETMWACNVEGREYVVSHTECAAVPGGGKTFWADFWKCVGEVDCICKGVLRGGGQFPPLAY